MKQKQQEFRHTPQKPDSGNDKQEAKTINKSPIYYNDGIIISSSFVNRKKIFFKCNEDQSSPKAYILSLIKNLSQLKKKKENQIRRLLSIKAK